jgi:hypothetical protein
MADPQIQQLLQAFGQLTGAAGNSRASLTAASQAMARLRTEMQRGTGTVQGQTAALQSSISQFAALDSATQKTAAGQQLLAQQAQAASQIFREAAGTMTAAVLKGGLAEAISYVTKQIFTSIGSYQEGASGIQTAFNMQNAAMESQIKILDRLSSGATIAAETLALIPNPYARIAAGAAGLVAGIAGVGKGFTELQATGMQALQKEMTTTTMTFDIMQKNGVLFAGGMTQMRETSGEMQLNLNEFAGVVGNSKKELMDFGNSVVGGVKKVRNVSLAFTDLAKRGFDYRKELERAGYSQQEQTEGTIQYMDMLNKSGQLRKMSDEQIAIGATEYLKNLKAISAFTGEDAKSAQARAKQAGEQLAVQAKLEKMGAGASERFQSAVKVMGPEMQKGLQQMVATNGTIVDKNLNILLAASPTRKKLLDDTYADMSNSALSAAEVNERYQQRVKENADALKKEGLEMGESIGTVSLLTGGLGEVTSMAEKQVDLGRKGEAAREAEIAQLGTTTEQMRKMVTEGIDPFKDTIVNAERQMREGLPRMMELLTSYATEYNKRMKGGEGPAGMLKEQQADLIKSIKAALEASSKGPAIEPGGKASQLANDAFSGLLGVVNKLSTVVGKMETAMDRLLRRNKGSLGETGKIFENFGAGTLVELHGIESVMKPSDVQALLENAQMGTLKALPAPAETATASEDANKMSEAVTSTLTNLATQMTNTSQMQIGKMDELISAMRDKTILEDMLAAMQDQVGYTKRIADNA